MERVGRYIVLDKLGEGGMGVVYSAYDPQLDRKVALKLLRQDADLRVNTPARLLREAQAMARLSHPNVLPVFDAGEWEGKVFLAMELVEGRTLREWIRAEKPDWRSVVNAYAAAGQGLAAAHSAGMVHRDFKPDNVLLGNDDRIQVTDFGLARQAKDAGSSVHLGVGTAWIDQPGESLRSSPTWSNLTLTRPGALVGTTKYMAPELFAGKEADARTDQFAFCVALYDALYGEHPFAGKGPEELRDAIAAHKLRTLPANSSVPKWLERIVLKGLSHEAEQRHPSMDALLRELSPPARFNWKVSAIIGLAGTVVLGLVLFEVRRGREAALCADAGRPVERVWNESRQQTIRSAFLATGLPFAQDAFGRVKAALDSEVAAWAQASVKACEATHVLHQESEETLQQRNRCLDELLIEVNALLRAFERADVAIVEKAAQAAQSLPGVRNCDQALVTPWLRAPSDEKIAEQVQGLREKLKEARGLMSAGLYASALENAKSVVDGAQTLRYRPLEAEALQFLGQVQWLIGDTLSENTLKQAVAAAEAVGHSRVVAQAAIDLVGYGSAIAGDKHPFWGQLAGAAIERLGGDEDLEAELAHGLMSYWIERGDLREALSQGLHALSLNTKMFGSDNLRTANTLRILSRVYSFSGDERHAQESLTRAIEIVERLLGPNHPERGEYLLEYAVHLHDRGQYQEAIPYYRQALSAIESSLGKAHPLYLSTQENFGRALVRAGQSELGIRLIREALPGLEPFDSYWIHATDMLGSALRESGQPRKAVQIFQRALSKAGEVHGADSPNYAIFVTHYAMSELAAGRPARARTLLEPALKILRSTEIFTVPRGQAEFALAQALGSSPRERKRARELALSAQQEFKRHPFRTIELDEIASWLERHPAIESVRAK